MLFSFPCDCLREEPGCSLCHNQEQINVELTYIEPITFDDTKLKFEPVAGLLQYFIQQGEVIGAGNIEFLPEDKGFFIYDIQTFCDIEGYHLMKKTLLSHEGISFIEGKQLYEECLH